MFKLYPNGISTGEGLAKCYFEVKLLCVKEFKLEILNNPLSAIGEIWSFYCLKQCLSHTYILLLLLPLALQPTVGFVLSNNILTFSHIYHQLSPSPHS